MRRLTLEALEMRLAPAVSTWNGAVGAMNILWSNPANWLSGSAPAPNDDLVFPSGVATTSTNDLAANTSFGSLTIGASGYTIGGNVIDLTGTVHAAQGSGSATLNLPVTFSGAGTITVDQTGSTQASLLDGGAIGGSGGLTKAGAGLLDLLGANTYTGATTVNGGVLYVNTTQASSPVTVNQGATLGGTGTVSTITSNSGTVSPGTSAPSLLTDTGDLNLGTGSTFAVQLNGQNAGTDYSQLVVNGNVNLGGATLSGVAGFTPTGNQSFVIIKNNGSNPVSGTFAGLAQGAEVTISNEPFQISYTGGAGHDVVLTSLVDSQTTVTPSSSTVTYPGQVSLTANVSSADPSFTQTPTGSVQFFNGSTSLGTATLTNGVATLNNVVLTGGTASVTAVYQGDSSFATSTSTAAPVTVSQASSTTTVSATPQSSVTGQQVALTAIVTAATPGGATPTGMVQFMKGTTSLGTATLSNGVALLNTMALTTSDTSVTANYQGDANYLTSTGSTPVTVTKAATTSLVAISPNPSGLNASVTLTATVSAMTPGSGSPTGTVQFFNGTTSLGSQTLAGGIAMLTTSSLPKGSNPISAVYEGDGNFTTSTSTTQNANVLNASTTTVTSSQSSITFNQTVTLTATVASATSGSTATPTGNVQFMDGSNSLGTAALTNGVATLPNVSLPAGTPSITAVYAGDTNYGSSTSTPITVTVAKSGTTTTLAVSPNPSGLGQTTTLTATIAAATSGSGTATGSVDFFNGTTKLGTGTITAGVATFTTTALPLGANLLSATYNGDSNFTTSTSSTVTANVDQASTTTLAASPTTGVTGQSITLTAKVAPATTGATPTGSVNFLNGSTVLGTSNLDSTGTAVLTTTSLTVGSPSITAQYQGDSTYAGSTSSAVTVTIAKANTATSVVVVPNPSGSGASVTLTATVTAASPGSGTPTGTVQFFNGTTSLGTATLLSNGTASTTSTALPVGASSITAQYLGDANYNTSTSPAVSQTVNPATTTTVASSPSPSVVGQPVTLTAGVSSSSGIPAGTVVFLNGTNTLGTATLNNGVATLVTSALPLGSDSITAQYTGSSSFSASTSSAITQTVQQASTTTAVTSSQNPAGLGQSVTFTATVTPASPSTGGPTPTGSVTFLDGTTSLGTGTLTSGVATFTSSSLAVGTHSITAVYLNDANYTASTSPALVQTVGMATTTVTLGVTTGNPVSNQAMVFTATLAAVSPATGTPSGTVNFFSNGTMFGSGTLTNGQTTLTFSKLALGNQTITAVYQGDSTFAAGTSSAPLQIKVGDGNQLYVNQLYLQVLHRIADPTGLANYSTLLANGFSRSYVVNQVIDLSHVTASALEQRILGAKASHNKQAQVTALYHALLGRVPTSGELRQGVRQLEHQNGSTKLIVSLLSSKEYFVAAFKKGSPGSIASTA